MGCVRRGSHSATLHLYVFSSSHIVCNVTIFYSFGIPVLTIQTHTLCLLYNSNVCVRVRTRVRSRPFERSHIHRLNFYSFHAYLMHLNCHFQYNKSIHSSVFLPALSYVCSVATIKLQRMCVCVCTTRARRWKKECEWWNKCPHSIRI